ncbi:MAG: hypothetical protein H7X94_13615 [Vallitaleaceae bacterium]|nr:hypothetical protein [Vallitaleaceae bacterium]
MKNITVIGSEAKVLQEMVEHLRESWINIEALTEVSGDILVIKDHLEEAIIENYLIMDIDRHPQLDLSAYLGFTVITVGYNSKASITVSSVIDEEIVFCVQREIVMDHTIIEPQEFVVNSSIFCTDDVLSMVFVFTILLLIGEKEFQQPILKPMLQE